MKITNKLIINVLLILSICVLAVDKAEAQGTYTVGGKFTAEQASDIVTGDLMKQGLERISELVKLAKNGKGKELSEQFASRQLVKNPMDSDDLAEYAVADTDEIDEELLMERVEFFKNLDKNCGKKKKVYVGEMSGDGEPIGHAFRLTLPGKIKGDDVACYHYTVSFRRTSDGKLLITEWYAMPGNMDCQ